MVKRRLCPDLFKSCNLFVHDSDPCFDQCLQGFRKWGNKKRLKSQDFSLFCSPDSTKLQPVYLNYLELKYCNIVLYDI